MSGGSGGSTDMRTAAGGPPLPCGFAVGTGRCGTQFLARVAQAEPTVAACHERDPLLQTFHRYCAWYGLPVDEAGYLTQMRRYVEGDLRDKAFSFESTAFVSLSVGSLHRALGARFVLLVRRPDQVVNSYLKKGWYDRPVVQADPSLALGYQTGERFHHFLGRTVPVGEEFARWNALTRVGKLAWYWATLNRRVADQFAGLPPSATRVVRLEDLDFDRYRELAAFLGYETTHTADTYAAVAAARPNSLDRRRGHGGWTDREAAEFETEIAGAAGRFGYPGRVADLPPDPPAADGPMSRGVFRGRLGPGVRRGLRRLRGAG